jgi:hypothetical protein
MRAYWAFLLVVALGIFAYRNVYVPLRGRRPFRVVAVKAEEQLRATYRERLERVRARVAAVRIRSDSREIVRDDREAR